MIDAYEFARGIKVLLLSEMPAARRPALQGIRCVALDSCAIELFGAPIAQLRAFARLIKTHLLEIHKIQQISTTISYASGGIVVRWDSVPQTNPPPVAMVIQINAFRRFRTKKRVPLGPISPKLPVVPQNPQASRLALSPCTFSGFRSPHHDSRRCQSLRNSDHTG